MAPGRKPARSREEFVGAAIAFSDEYGIDALTLRSLGRSVGAATTAVYRYFDSKDALVVAMRETLLEGAYLSPVGGSPRDRLIAYATGFRSAVKAHPCLSQIMGMPAFEGDATNAVVQTIVSTLAELGLSGPLLVRGHRQLESFVVGSSAFDYSDAPRHLDERQQRMARLGFPEFTVELSDAAAVEASNEDAFVTTLTWIIDGLTAESR